MVGVAISNIFKILIPQAFGVLVMSIYIWGPIFLLYLSWNIWLKYIRAKFISEQENVLLEIKLPKEQNKSPVAMELVLNALNQGGGESTFIDKYIKGGLRAWFSLELVSIEGKIHFFIWTRKKFVDVIEHQVYGQYPNAEVHHSSDYTNFLKYSKEAHALWGCEFALLKPDPYPIKTYIDYSLDRDPKEEFKIDPLTSVLEFLGSLGKGEQAWIQIIIRTHKKERIKRSGWFKKEKVDWKDEANEIINDLMKRDPKTKLPIEEVKNDSGFSMKVSPSLTKEEQNIISAIERDIAKPAFDTGIRGIYIAESDSFKPVAITGLTGSFKQYNSTSLNGFKPTRGLTIFDYPWQDFKDMRKNKVKRELFDAYRRRSYFHPPYKSPQMVLNAEELATIFHFPGEVAQTPTFKRIESRASEPPSNLPI